MSAKTTIEQALTDSAVRQTAENDGWSMDVKQDSNDPNKYIVRLRRPEGSSGAATRVNQALQRSKRTLKKVEIKADRNGNVDLAVAHQAVLNGFHSAFNSIEYRNWSNKRMKAAWDAEQARKHGGPSA
ncbi:uncharacterized protein FOMMEDRAFT_31209 [Fomitiporia mediterranea MF3/22]|uniref:uncharacterized protein n=1 Tax=Fomitiporia mediterranea (strain MF3/22) TaxID=694068 RepID=UPI0004408A15|nr:uncharacterized protein FOMMEDRAFT_31209 [Fomitiporia mediterranea MF3/22]EJC99546.1 hypothetical protein FOMMEDRAFT_31209 [Fomitiporia mediterranea MF3/22]